MTIVDSKLSNPLNEAIRLAGKLTLDRVVISGGVTAILAQSGSMLDATNLLVFGTSGPALDLSNTSGVMRFSTVVNKAGSGAAPLAILCSSVNVQSSIVWTPGTTPMANNCSLASTIAGPIAVAGASNTDPMFVDEANDDYHLSTNSPAKDVVDIGPTFDFEGDPRPRGNRFDLGADEAP